MKKIYLSLLALALSGAAFSQGNSSYKGAIEPSGDLAADWTAGWANWNPNNTNYPATNDNTFSNPSKLTKITSGQTLTLDATKVYLLTDLVVVEAGGKLVIPAGTIIRGAADLVNQKLASIFVNRGGEIQINGTKSNPVIFTSNADKGSRASEDWGGIVICGNAQSNQASGVRFEASPLVPTALYSNTELGAYGGGSSANNAENKVTITYARIEFPGLDYSTDKEINGLTLCAVGSGATLDNIMIYESGDDAFEWFGGTANAKHLIAVGTVDDDFDTDHGFTGTIEYGISVKNVNKYISDANGGGNTSNTFESDNDAAGAEVYPKTAAKFFNITSVGPIAKGQTDAANIQTNPKYKLAWVRAALLRRNTQTSIYNSVFYGWPTAIDINDNKTLRNAGIINLSGSTASYKSLTESSDDTLKLKNNEFRGIASGFQAPGTTFNRNAFVASIANSETTTQKVDTIASFLLKSFNMNTKVDSLGAYFGNNGATDAPSFMPPVVTGLEELNEAGQLVSVYPNPSANGSFDVAFSISNNENVSVQVINYVGQVVGSKEGSLNAGNNLISFSGISSGVYLVKVTANDSSSVVRVIVK
jgi:hypothetical protein